MRIIFMMDGLFGSKVATAHPAPVLLTPGK